MGVLEHPATGRREPLASDLLVGRDAACFVRLSDARASGVHARLRWTGLAWAVRDLGSRNGTWLNRERLDGVDERVVPPGATLDFGHTGERWVLASSAPPVALALCLSSGARVEASRELLALPSEENPEVVVCYDGQNWQLEQDAASRAVADQELVTVGNEPWRLFLPMVAESTRQTDDSLPDLACTDACFRVSQDEEHVDLTFRWPGGEVYLEPRAHLYALLTLARERLAATDQPDGERGWLAVDRLAKMLGTDRKTLNVHLWRAREQVARVGFLDANMLFERRHTSAQIRIGLSQITISRF